ncbi:MAG: phosphodiester glycosidase family protein [Planctomycetes bacterium]|nr:phosphodiester glycosidase family protein [Planctomycetota bacterium]
MSSLIVPFLVLGLGADLATPAQAQARREFVPVFQGVSYFHERRRLPRPLSLHAVAVELGTEGLGFIVTPAKPGPAGPKQEVTLRRTTTFAREARVQVAINGTFFDTPGRRRIEGLDADICFLAVHDGRTYSARSSDDEVIVRTLDARLELWVRPGPPSWLFQPGDGQMALGMARWAQLLRDGSVVASTSEDIHPRTAVGTTRDGRRALFLIVDGRQPGFSEGVTLLELAWLLESYGVHDALNLDGGGSSTLVLQQPDGSYRIMNCPSDGYPLSIERPVGTHLGIFAKPVALPNRK